MTDSTPSTRVRHAGGPYRSPARASGPGDVCAASWAAALVDVCLVMVIAVTVATIGHWPALVDMAAQNFLGF